jgi:chlorobactene glucosyltransferase
MIGDGFLERSLTVILLLQLALVFWNRREMARPAPRAWGRDAPLVSILVPARNEEGNIGRCLDHLLAQDYPNLEIVVVDDASTDATAAVVGGYADGRLRLIAARPLPPGWSGKNWACHQLYQAARGRILCFVDADTTLAPGTISAAAGLLDDHGAGLVSLLPRSGSTSAAGKVLLPMVTHALLALFPIGAVHRARHPMVSVAIGPFMMVSRAAYDAAGGHAAAPDHVVDDVQLSRNVKRAGHRVRLGTGTDLVETAWYESAGDMWRGFSKNSFAALDNNPGVGFAVLLLIIPALLLPFIRVGMGLLGDGAPEAAVAQCLLILATRAVTSLLGRDPLWTVPLHPVMIAFWGATLAHSMSLYAFGGSVAWKDRDVPSRPV